MAFSGGLGARLSLSGLSEELSDPVLLFSESNTRFLAEVPEPQADAFERHFQSSPIRHIGHVTGDDRLVIENAQGRPLIDSTLASLRNAWQRPFADM